MDTPIVGKKEDGWSGRTSQNDRGKDEKRYRDLEILLARNWFCFKVLLCALFQTMHINVTLELKDFLPKNRKKRQLNVVQRKKQFEEKNK